MDTNFGAAITSVNHIVYCYYDGSLFNTIKIVIIYGIYIRIKLNSGWFAINMSSYLHQSKKWDGLAGILIRSTAINFLRIVGKKFELDMIQARVIKDLYI